MINSRRCISLLLCFQFVCGFPIVSWAQDTPTEDSAAMQDRSPGELMTVERIDMIVGVIDPTSIREGNLLTFRFVTEGDIEVAGQIVSDVSADRMRIVIGITDQDALTPELMTRILQANFDSALDARYAFAQGFLWSTFIHPLSSLSDEDFVSGLSQTITLFLTFGTTFTSGALVYGGGDSSGIEEDILEALRQERDSLRT